MREKGRKGLWMTIVSVTILIALVIVMLIQVESIQGNARVVNYAGIVRGATQRLVKNELYGNPDDGEIARLDEILDGLQNGGGKYGLIKMPDRNYLKRLDILGNQWKVLKELIYGARADEAYRDILYSQSEAYFDMADDTVQAAEEYADGMASRMRVPEILIAADIVFIFVIFALQAKKEIQQNRRLKSIAYIDELTGLPNKRSCSERLYSDKIIPEDVVVGCMMFDLNNLKVVNDTLGHEAGDVLISSFASMLRRTAPADMFVGRFGGDEFVGVSERTSKSEVELFLSKLENSIASMNDVQTDNGIRISYAYGYALSSEHAGVSLKVLMDLADRNMYIKKAEMKKTTDISAK